MWARWTLHSSAKRMQINISAKVKSNIITGVAALLLAAVGVAAILVWAGVIERQPTPTPAPVALPAATPIPADAWQDVASWVSSGRDDSPPFHVSADAWRVMWVATNDSVGDGSFAVHIYNPDGLFLLNLYDTADDPKRNFDGPIRGTLGVPGAGDFFIRVITDRDYQVTVQEPR